MSSEDMEAIVRRFVEEVQTAHKIEVMDELIGNDFVDHGGNRSGQWSIDREA